MRILLAHNQYRERGGEDTAVENEIRLLREQSHDVRLYQVSNRDLTSLGLLETSVNVTRSRAQKLLFKKELEAFSPHVVHVHNFFPQLTPSLHEACAEKKIASIQVLHNYRILCANALLLRDHRPCELCITGSPYQAVRFGCYRGSRLASLPVARMIASHRRQKTWSRIPSRIVALTEFAKKKFVESGVDPGQIEVKPNFAWDPGPGPCEARLQNPARSPSFLYVGRLSPEKGIGILMEAWKDLPFPLRVAGDGPLGEELRALASPHIKFLGRLSAEQTRQEMQNAGFLIVPSLCYEGFPMVIAEAYALGLSVLASDQGSLKEIVEEGVHGFRFNPDAPSLAQTALLAAQASGRMKEFALHARSAYLARFSPQAQMRRWEEIHGALRNIRTTP